MSSNHIYTCPLAFLENHISEDVRLHYYLTQKQHITLSAWRAYQTGRKTNTIFNFLDKIAVISDLYFRHGMQAESILPIIGWRPKETEYLRITLARVMRNRTADEEHIRRNHHRQKCGRNNSRPDLFGIEDEVIRLYKCGRSSEVIAADFNCSPDHIRAILHRENIINNTFYSEKVRKTGLLVQVETKMAFSEEKKADIRSRTAASRIELNSNTKSREKYISTIRRKYNDPQITNVSQVPSIHDKQQQYKYHPYTFASGETVNIQGWENLALDELQKLGIGYKDISLRQTFKYASKGKTRIYYADIVVSPTQKIIEVKSKWTLIKYAEKNRMILDHIANTGMLFEFWVYLSKKTKIVISTISQFDLFVSANNSSSATITALTNSLRTMS
jgi:hypothetical protein